MASAVTESAPSTAMSSMMTSTSFIGSSNTMTIEPDDDTSFNEYHTVLLVIYSVILLSGGVSLSLMMHIMKFSTASITSIGVLNLIFTHFIFLLTVPFRIYYYATDQWRLGLGWCKVISGMIHIHMYMSFIFYVIILITRLMTFYNKADLVASSSQGFHALIVSAGVWMVVLIVVPCVIYYTYGRNAKNEIFSSNNSTSAHCFQFGKHIRSADKVVDVKVLNYITSTVIIVLTAVLAGLQANVLRVLYRKHRQGCTSQQDFLAQLNSLCFALIMVVCFIPYHMFRLKYVNDLSLQNVNEVFLSLTTFNCLDMLTFLGRRTCNACLPRKAF